MARGTWLVASATALLLGLSTAPAQALTATPPNVVYSSSQTTSAEPSTVTETADLLGTVVAATASSPERFFVKTGFGTAVATLRSTTNGSGLSVGTWTYSGSSSYETASPLRVQALDLVSCSGPWETVLTVSEAGRTAGVLTSLAADWMVTCRYAATPTQVKSRAVGSLRFGTSAPYGEVGVGSWTPPAALPADRTESITLPVTGTGDGASITSVAVVAGPVAVTADTCSGATATAASPCAITLLMDPPDNLTSDLVGVSLDLTMADGRVVRVVRRIPLRQPLTAPVPKPYPVAAGIEVAVPGSSYGDDVVTVSRRPAGGGSWTTIGTTPAALPAGGGLPRVLDSSAVRGTTYEYTSRLTTADGRFSSDLASAVPAKRPSSDPVPTTRTRLAVHSGSGSQAPNLADTDTGLTTGIVVVGDGAQTQVSLTDGGGLTAGLLAVSLIAGPGVYDYPAASYVGVSAQSLGVPPVPGSRLVVRSVLYADDGTLLALDASVRGPSGSAEVRFRTGGGVAVPVLEPSTATFLADPGSSSGAQQLTLTNTGPDPITVGGTSFSGVGAGSFTGTTCSAATLAAAASCTLSATYHGAASPTTTTAELAVATSVGATALPAFVPLTARTTSVPTAPGYLFATRVPGRVIVQWGTPSDDGGRPVTGGFLERSVVGSGSWQAVAPSDSGTYWAVDPAPPAGDLVYRVSAVTSRGTGAASTPVQAVAAELPLLIAGSAGELDSGAPFGLHVGSTFSDVTAPLQVDGHEHETPTASPDGSSVVFSRAATAGAAQYDYDLWRIGIAPGSVAAQLTSMPGAEVDAEVSPDGSRIAFTYYPPLGAPDLAPQVWTIASDGSDPVLRLTGYSHPSWVTSSVLVASDDRTVTGSLARVSVVGGVTGPPVTIAGTAGGFDPTVSPDGSTVAFVSGAGVPSTLVLATGGLTEFGGSWSQEDLAVPTWLTATTTAWGRTDVVSGASLRGIMLPSYSGGPGAELAAVPADDGVAPVIGAVPGYVRNGGTLSVPVSDTGSPRASVTVTCSVDGAAGVPCTNGLAISGLAAGAHALTVTAADVFGNTANADRSFIVDDVAPGTATLVVSAYSFTTTATASFRAVDSSPVVFEVRQRSWPLASTAPKPFVTLTTGQSATSRSIAVPIATRVCVQVRAKDLAGNVGAWSVERCTTTPLDDRRMKRATTGWASASGSAFYGATATLGKKVGLRLVSTTGIGASRLALVATTCPNCGSVIVYHRGVKVGTVSLRSSTTVARKVILLPLTGYRYGVIEVRTTSARLVRIDGVIPLR